MHRTIYSALRAKSTAALRTLSIREYKAHLYHLYTGDLSSRSPSYPHPPTTMRHPPTHPYQETSLPRGQLNPKAQKDSTRSKSTPQGMETRTTSTPSPPGDSIIVSYNTQPDLSGHELEVPGLKDTDVEAVMRTRGAIDTQCSYFPLPALSVRSLQPVSFSQLP